MSAGLFQNIINKMCLQIIYILYVLALFDIKQPVIVDMP